MSWIWAAACGLALVFALVFLLTVWGPAEALVGAARAKPAETRPKGGSFSELLERDAEFGEQRGGIP